MEIGVNSDTKEYMEIISNPLNIKGFKHRRLQTNYNLCVLSFKTS